MEKNYDKTWNKIQNLKSMVYRPEFKNIPQLQNNTNAAILLNQILYWYQKKGKQPFYKFKMSCSHKLYKRNDSWCEELNFTRDEYDTAIKKIGMEKYKYNENTKDVQNALIWRWTKNNVTYFQVNEKALEKAINYITELDMQKIAKENEPTTSENEPKKAKAGIPLSNNTKNTSFILNKEATPHINNIFNNNIKVKASLLHEQARGTGNLQNFGSNNSCNGKVLHIETEKDKNNSCINIANPNPATNISNELLHKTQPRPKIIKTPNPFGYSPDVQKILNHWALKGGKVSINPSKRKQADRIAGIIEELLLPGRNEYISITDNLELKTKQWTVKEIISCIDLYSTMYKISDWFFDQFVCYKFNKYTVDSMNRNNNKKNFSALLNTYEELEKEPTETERILKNRFTELYPDVKIYPKTISKISSFIDKIEIDYKTLDSSSYYEPLNVFVYYIQQLNQIRGNTEQLKYMGTDENLNIFLLNKIASYVFEKRTPDEKAEYLRMKPIWAENIRKAKEQQRLAELNQN